MAERLGNQATNQKVAGSIPGCEKNDIVPGQGTSLYLPRGNVPVLSLWIGVSAKMTECKLETETPDCESKGRPTSSWVHQ